MSRVILKKVQIWKRQEIAGSKKEAVQAKKEAPEKGKRGKEQRPGKGFQRPQGRERDRKVLLCNLGQWENGRF